MSISKLYFTITLIAVAFLWLNASPPQQSDDQTSTNKEIIKFSHSYHAEEELAECVDCHAGVLNSVSLNDRLLPDHNDCQNCHDVNDETLCEDCHYEDVYENLIQSKSELFFNHSIHIGNEILCTDCHAGITNVDYGFQTAQKIPQMQTCATCHNETQIASNACETCHVVTFNLLPQNHRSAGYMRLHKFSAWSADADCMMCHDNATCQECHVATTSITETNAADGFYQPYMPSNSITGPGQQIILKKHADLNYRYSHGIDAKGKSGECQTCHQIESFCGNCHNADNTDFALSGIIPASHLLPNFKTIGVGTGGGEHAILAKRDIEGCVSCHDIQGADPTCVMCHLDSDGIKGTNPKTHAPNFMRLDKGDWHESMGSICYNCHTSASPVSSRSDGFCNYCHGL